MIRKNILGRVNSTLAIALEEISELEYVASETNKNQAQSIKRLNKKWAEPQWAVGKYQTM